ncbi:MAG: hypothetical protein OEV39_11015, partial [Gammaproteobacteria bacterium]|nr:hypothetical protein [Gammaproteobacteria bacterium]
MRSFARRTGTQIRERWPAVNATRGATQASVRALHDFPYLSRIKTRLAANWAPRAGSGSTGGDERWVRRRAATAKDMEAGIMADEGNRWLREIPLRSAARHSTVRSGMSHESAQAATLGAEVLEVAIVGA